MNKGPQDFLPTWTKPGQWSLGRDPLGMQATSVRMYRTLVPGLTNVTNRLRYYSYYCWVIAHWAKVRHTDDDLEWCLFIRRAEALYALACEVVEPDTLGLAGSDWARKYWAEFKGTSIDLAPHTDRPGEQAQYLMAKRGNFGQFYIASMMEVKLLGNSERIPIVAKDGEDLADGLAEAMGKQVSEQLAAAVNSGKLSPVDLHEIGKALHPSKLNDNSREMSLLRDFIWPKTVETSGSKERRTSAWLLLDLASKGVNISDETLLRRAFYHRVLPNGTPYRPEGKVIDRWRAYHANELCHIALEALLNALIDPLLSHVEGLSPTKLIEDLMKLVIPEEKYKARWTDWAASVANGALYVEDMLSVEVLHGLKRHKERAQDPKVLLAAIKLLGVLWDRWSAGAQNVRTEVAQFSVRSGASLEGVFLTLEDVSSSTVSEALEAVVRRHVIAEHLAIAGRKLALSGKYTNRFVLEDGVLSNGVVTEYGYTNPRLGNLATFLVDAKLVDLSDGITASGLRLLNDYQPA